MEDYLLRFLVSLALALGLAWRYPVSRYLYPLLMVTATGLLLWMFAERDGVITGGRQSINFGFHAASGQAILLIGSILPGLLVHRLHRRIHDRYRGRPHRLERWLATLLHLFGIVAYAAVLFVAGFVAVLNG